jgi:hypothetical protein
MEVRELVLTIIMAVKEVIEKVHRSVSCPEFPTRIDLLKTK